MKAVWLKEFGGPEVLVAADASDPVAGSGPFDPEVQCERNEDCREVR